MKKLLYILLILFSSASYGQTIYTGTLDSSVKVPINLSGAVRTMYGLDFLNKGLTTSRINALYGYTPANPANFQPLENQRLSTTNAPTFAGLTSNGILKLIGLTGTPAAAASGTQNVYADSTGAVTFQGSNAFPFSISKARLTGPHRVYPQNKDYTLADSSDVSANTIAIAGKLNKSDTATQVVSPITIAAWGDSQIAGSGSSTDSALLDDIQRGTGYRYYNGGVSGETSTQIRTRMLAATDKLKYPVIIWAGRNNYNAPTTVKADIAAMVAALGHTRYLIVGILNGDYSNEYSGQGDYNTIVTLNSDLATLYGSHFINIRSYIVNKYNSGIAQDVIDFGHDVPPSSLRVDQLHLNSTGYYYVAQKIDSSIALLRGEDSVVTTKNIIDLFGRPPVLGAVSPNRINATYANINELRVSGTSISSGNAIYYGYTSAGDSLANETPFTVGKGVRGGWSFVNGNPATRNILKGYNGTTQTMSFDPNAASYINTGAASQFSVGSSATNGYAFEVTGTARITDQLSASSTTVSGVPFSVGSGGTAGWQFSNGGNPTSRVLIKGYSASSELIRFDPSNNSFFTNALVVGTTSTTFKFEVNGTAKIGNTLTTTGLIKAFAAKTAAYTATATDEVITGDATGAAFSITLPTAVGKTGQVYTIKKIDASANAVTVATTSSQTIDAATTYALSAQYKYVTVISNGANWIITANN